MQWLTLHIYTKAFYWYKKSAEKNHLYGQNNLATLYKKGQGVDQDYDEAIRLYKKVAEQGYMRAHNYLAYNYANCVFAKFGVRVKTVGRRQLTCDRL